MLLLLLLLLLPLLLLLLLLHLHLIQGRMYAHMQVVAGVAGNDHMQPLLSWKLPRDMDRGCVGVGFELEVMGDV